MRNWPFDECECDEEQERILSESEHTARKDYTCSRCRKPIEKGTRYRRIAYTIYGDFETAKEHLECPEPPTFYIQPVIHPWSSLTVEGEPLVSDLDGCVGVCLVFEDWDAYKKACPDPTEYPFRVRKDKT